MIHQHSAGSSHKMNKVVLYFVTVTGSKRHQILHKGESKIIQIFKGNSKFREVPSKFRESCVGDDGDALLDDGGLALPVGQPELCAEEDVLAVGVEVHRQRDGRVLSKGAQFNSASTRGMGLMYSKLWIKGTLIISISDLYSIGYAMLNSDKCKHQLMVLCNVNRQTF